MRRINNKGFSLLEVLIAFFILVMGVSFIYSVFPLGMRMSQQTRNLSSISFFAQKKIEELKTSAQALSNSTGEENNFNWTLAVTDYTTPENINLQKMQLDITWLEGQGQRKKTFITYLK